MEGGEPEVLWDWEPIDQKSDAYAQLCELIDDPMEESTVLGRSVSYNLSERHCHYFEGRGYADERRYRAWKVADGKHAWEGDSNPRAMSCADASALARALTRTRVHVHALPALAAVCAAPCARRCMRSPLYYALAAPCARRSLRSPLYALAAPCARCSLRSLLPALTIVPCSSRPRVDRRICPSDVSARSTALARTGGDRQARLLLRSAC